MEPSREALQEVLQRTPKEDIIEMLIDLLDATDAGAPYSQSDFVDSGSCCSCAMDSPEDLMPYHSPDDEEEDVSLVVYMDDPDNHDQFCSYRISREILRRLGFHYEPRHVRLAVPGVAKDA